MKTEKIKILQNVHDSQTHLVHLQGETIEVSEEKAKNWIQQGYAQKVEKEVSPLNNK